MQIKGKKEPIKILGGCLLLWWAFFYLFGSGRAIDNYIDHDVFTLIFTQIIIPALLVGAIFGALLQGLYENARRAEMTEFWRSQIKKPNDGR